MWIKREPQREMKLLEWIIIPGATYVTCLLTWLWLIESASFESPHKYLINLVFLAVFTYEVGIKGFLNIKRVTYFNAVFSFPCLVAVTGVAGGYMYASA